MISSLLWHLALSLGLFVYGLLSLTMANGNRVLLAERNRPRLGLLLMPVVALLWPLWLLGHAGWAWYQWRKHGGVA